MPISVYPISGSPAPIFESDEECTHLLVTLAVHPDYSDQASDQVNDLVINTLDDVKAFVKNISDQASNQLGIVLFDTQP